MTLEEISSNLSFVPVADMEWPEWPSNKSQTTMDEYNKQADLAIQTREEVLRPGAVLRLKSGALKLVGHVNANLGVCDDCVDFNYSDISEVAYLY